MPKVSVIMPAFNCERFIEEAVRSVLAQTESDFELLVVDDGSTDRTPALLAELSSLDARVTIYRQPNSGRPGMARNVGISRSQGEFLAFLDGDDLYHPAKLERQLACFVRYPGVDIVFHDHRRFGSAHDQATTNATLQELHYLQRAGAYLTPVGDGMFLCREDFHKFVSLEIVGIHTSSIMFRRSVLESEQVWFREDIAVGEDHDLWLRITRGRRVALLDAVLSSYRLRPGSLTFGRSPNMVEDALQPHLDNLARSRDIFTPAEVRKYRRRIGKCYSHLGYAAFRRVERRRARQAYLKSMQFRPRLGTAIAWLKTFAPNAILRWHRGGRTEAQQPASSSQIDLF